MGMGTLVSAGSRHDDDDDDDDDVIMYATAAGVRTQASAMHETKNPVKEDDDVVVVLSLAFADDRQSLDEAMRAGRGSICTFLGASLL